VRRCGGTRKKGKKEEEKRGGRGEGKAVYPFLSVKSNESSSAEGVGEKGKGEKREKAAKLC